jgi:hypothetical protein
VKKLLAVCHILCSGHSPDKSTEAALPDSSEPHTVAAVDTLAAAQEHSKNNLD